MSNAQYSQLETHLRADAVLEVRLDRPKQRNAFNAVLIEELTACFELASANSALRVVLLSGNGKVFCAGADIDWMRSQGELGREANLASAKQMADMFETIRSCAKPVIAKVHGAALGGGTGLTAAADIAITSHDTVFGFSEVRLGIIPAVISPYIVEKLGPAHARALFLLGSRFDGREAERVGLVFRAVAAVELDSEVEKTVQSILAGGPQAVIAAKALSLALSARDLGSERELTSRSIAEIRGTDEAREGLSAFLDQRKPAWLGDGDD